MNSVLNPKSEDFALRVVRLYRFLTTELKEYVLSKQLLRAGTSIGANIAEANYAQTKADFVSKMSIALKEAAETVYWIRLLYKSGYLTEEQYISIYTDAEEVLKLLTSTVKTARKNIE